MLVALILVSLGFVALLAYVMFGQPQAGARPQTGTNAVEQNALQATESELDKRRKELEEQRGLVQQLRGELKQLKKKAFDQRESEKLDQDLVKARTEVERGASVQLEAAREELATALAELAKLKADPEVQKRRSNASLPAVTAPQKTPAPVTVEKSEPVRRFRELSDADKERIERLEHQSSKDRAKALDLDREVKRLKGRNETQHRVYVVIKGELDLLKDKFKALEKRLNRTLLERDLVKRAIKDLERKTGTNAERTELTAEEIAASDKKVEDRLLLENAEAERRTASLAKEESVAVQETPPAEAQNPPSPASSDLPTA